MSQIPTSDAIGSGVTGQDLLAAAKAVLDNLFDAAANYTGDSSVEPPVWLHLKLDNETGERRALVRKVVQIGETSHVGSGGAAGSIIDVQEVLTLEVEREPFWERPTSRTFPVATPAAAVAVAYDYTAAGSSVTAHDIVGAGARINALYIGPADDDELGRVWCGLRSANKHGTLSNFVPVWELEDGTNNGNESGITDHADATASDGNCVQVVETDLEWDDTWQEVCSIELGDVSANESDNFGKFLVLLRAQLTANATAWDVQLRYGYLGMDDDDFIKGAVVEVSDTVWEIHEMDTDRPVPIRDLHIFPLADYGDSYENGYTIQVWARRTSGAANLELDCLIMIPTDEGSYTVNAGLTLDYDTDPTGDMEPDLLLYGAAPDSDGGKWKDTTIVALSYLDGGYPKVGAIVPPNTDNFMLPPGDGRLIIAYARADDAATKSDITDQIIVNGRPSTDQGAYYELWYTMRGEE